MVPAVDGHAAQRTVTVAKGFVSLRFADDLLVRFADASQFELSRTLATTSALKAFTSGWANGQ